MMLDTPPYLYTNASNAPNAPIVSNSLFLLRGVRMPP